MTASFSGGRVWFGGDYNPEQWGPDVWAEDDELMREAGVDTATVGVFAWSSLEPEPGRYEFGWLDRTLDRLHANGVRVVLATPTASPPPWFTLAHPDAMPVTAEGVRLSHGSRDTYCAAAPAYREAARRIAETLASRYAGHPALAMWHIHNEYGTVCHCDHAAAAFRRWLRDRYHDDLDGLADAWNAAFWSQRYSSWEQILPPRATQYLPNPAQTLDFARFWSDELLAAYTEQRDVVRRHTPGVPVTTNFMLPPDYQSIDFWRWSREVDVVAVDHYPDATGLAGRADLAFGADRARSWCDGRPWLLMEQSPSVVHPRGRGVIAAKEPGQLLRDSLGYLARGSDSVMFFQWRAGRGGAELHHGAMVPHAGRETRVFREVTELGALLGRLAEITGSTPRAEVAVLWDADAWWALESRGMPSAHLQYVPALRAVHAALWRAGVTSDFVHPEGDLARYRAVFAPSAYLYSAAGAANLRRFVADGGHLAMGCFTGVADECHRIHLGGYPGGLMDVVGLRVEEFHPQPPDSVVRLTREEGTPSAGTPWTGTLWSEHLDPRGCEVVAAYADGVLAGRPAVTRHRFGAGVAWYSSTRLDTAALADLTGRVLAEARIRPELPGAPADVEAVRRHATGGRSWLFVFNHGRTACDVRATGTDLVSGRRAAGTLHLTAGAAAVVREE